MNDLRGNLPNKRRIPYDNSIILGSLHQQAQSAQLLLSETYNKSGPYLSNAIESRKFKMLI